MKNWYWFISKLDGLNVDDHMTKTMQAKHILELEEQLEWSKYEWMKMVMKL